MSGAGIHHIEEKGNSYPSWSGRRAKAPEGHGRPKPFIHAHAALGDNTFAVRGGHLREAVVSVTCEVTLTRFKDDIGRKKDAATGLFLLDPKPDEG